MKPHNLINKNQQELTILLTTKEQKMQLEQLKTQLTDEQFSVDEFGRTVINNPETWNMIAGASSSFSAMMPDGNCGCSGGNCDC